jgi:hypothetical protein
MWMLVKQRSQEEKQNTEQGQRVSGIKGEGTSLLRLSQGLDYTVMSLWDRVLALRLTV